MSQSPQKSNVSFLNQASEELYQALFEQAADGIFIANPQGQYIEVNRCGREMLGYSREEILSLSMKDLISEEDLRKEPLHMDEFRAGKALHIERRLRCKDGSFLPVEISAQMLADGNLLGMVRDISKRSQAQEALRASERRLQLAAEAAKMGQWDWNIITGEVEWSPQCLAHYGIPPDTQMSYERFLQAVHPDDREHVDAALRRAVEERGSYDELKRTVWQDGSLHWTASRGKVYCDDAGEPVRMVGVTFDMTKWKEAEEKHQAHLRLLENMDRVNRAIQGTSDLEQMMHDVLDLILTIFDCDRAALVYPCDPETDSWRVPMERTRPKYLGIGSLGLDMPIDPEVAETFRIIRAANSPVQFGPEAEHSVPREVSEQFGLQSFMGMALYPKEGKPWEFVLHQCSSPRVWTAEEERLFQKIGWRLTDGLTSLLTLNKLRDSERKLIEAGRIAHVGWWDRDFVADTIALSEESRRIFGLPLEEQWKDIAQWNERWMGLIHPDDRAKTKEAATQALQGGSRYDVEYRVVHPSGEVRYVRSQGDVSWDEAGHPRRIFGIMQDITDQVQLEAENEQLTAKFYQAQKMESIGRLAGGIAHDFNNLLTPILGYIDLSQAVVEPDSQLFEYLTQVKDAAERAAVLTCQILAFSRQQVLELRILNVNEVIDGFKQLLQRLIGEDIEVQTLLSPILYPVKADKGQVEQVLMNLAVNARDAMPSGGSFVIKTENAFLDEASIEKYAIDLVQGHYAVIAVQDSGEGMNAEQQTHIFDPFFTTKETGKGTGLGLATVFGIVKQHHGHIGVFSEPGQGTTFKIYLPKAEDSCQKILPVKQETQSSSGTETVLVVEDEEMVRKLVCETLEVQGYDVIEVAKPADCLELASAKIDLLLTDVIMPGMNGKTLYQKLAADHPGIKVLYMSGYTNDVIELHDILPERVNFIQKPFILGDLVRKVREVLD